MAYFHYQMKQNHGMKYKTIMQKRAAHGIDNDTKKNKFWGSVNFTDEEDEFLRNSRKEHFTRMKKLRINLRDNQSALFNEIRKTKPDTNLIYEYKAKTLKTQEEIIDESIFFYENLKTKLNEEQMQTINNHLSRKFHSKKNKKSKKNR